VGRNKPGVIIAPIGDAVDRNPQTLNTVLKTLDCKRKPGNRRATYPWFLASLVRKLLMVCSMAYVGFEGFTKPTNEMSK
jgi:hypothetical protein